MTGFNGKRLKIALVCGALLGILCIFGVGLRLGFGGNEIFILANWYNRVVMGLVIGLAGGITVIKSKFNPVLRGLVLGLMVSLALFLSSELRDPLGFMAGIGYGLIIDYLASKYS